MFSRHVTKNLSAYCHGELALEESRKIAEHLIACRNCRGEFEQIKLGVRFAENIPRVPAPDTLWPELEAQLERFGTTRKISTVLRVPESKGAYASWRPRFAAMAAILILTLDLSTRIWRYVGSCTDRWCTHDWFDTD